MWKDNVKQGNIGYGLGFIKFLTESKGQSAKETLTSSVKETTLISKTRNNTWFHLLHGAIISHHISFWSPSILTTHT